MPIPAETIHLIGSSDYVHSYEYSIDTISFSFDWIRYDCPPSNRFAIIEGVSLPGLLSIEEGQFELYSGRSFTFEEINETPDNGIAPLMITREVAELNNLYVGAVITKYNSVFSLPDYAVVPDGGFNFNTDEEIWTHPYFVMVYYPFEYELIEILEFVGSSRTQWIRNGMINRLYAPNWRTYEKRMIAFNSQILSNEIFNFNNWDEVMMERATGHRHPLWNLNSIVYKEAFIAENEQLLPYFWTFESMASLLTPAFNSMQVINEITDSAFVFFVVAGILVLSLVIVLFLKDRKRELGIYIALGEKKSRIVKQFLAEIIIISFLGFIIAVFPARLIANEISRNILSNQFTEHANREANRSETDTHFLIQEVFNEL